MSKLLAFLSPLGLGGDSPQNFDDDFVDRFNHSTSIMVLVIFAILVTTKQYVGEQIHCWVPGHFTSNYADYANKVCYVSNTYYRTFDEDIPKPSEDRRMITYYQWVPMILLFQAILFYLPCLFWRSLSPRAGVEISNVVQAGRSLQDSENKEKTIRYMMRMMDRFLGHYRDYTHGCMSRMKHQIDKRCPIICGRKYGNYLITIYIVHKVLYLTNALCQLFFMDFFLGENFHFYGIEVLRYMIRNEEWPQSRLFPRVTLCDFKVRQLGNIHRHTVQCVLPINFFNEKIFMVLWFWLVIVCIVTSINLLLWIIRTLFRRDQLEYVRRHLRYMDRIARSEDKKITRRFVNDYLRNDGVLVIKLVSVNASDLAASELTAELWDYYKSNPPSYTKKSDIAEV